MSLYIGKRIHSYHWKELPICKEVIERVEQLAIKEKQPLLFDNHPIFEWSQGNPVETPNEAQENYITENEDITDTLSSITQENNDNFTEDTENIDDEIDTIISEINKDVEQMDEKIDTVIGDINNFNYDDNSDENNENDISEDLEDENAILDDIDEDDIDEGKNLDGP